MTNTNITFTLNGAVYEMTANGRFYCTPLNGKKTRIGKLAYEAAYNQYTAKMAEEKPETKEEPVDVVIEERDEDYEKQEEKIPEKKAEVKPEPKGLDKLTKLMKALGYEPCESEFGDIRFHTPGGMSKVMGFYSVEEGLKWIEENIQKAKKPEKKPRTKKVQEGGFEYDNDGTKIILTAKQADFFKHLPDTDFWENGVDSVIWVDCLCDEIGGQFTSKPMTVGAMISTICEKGLGSRVVDRRDGRKCTQFALTDLGKKIAIALGL